MNKKELVERISRSNAMSQVAAREALDAIISSMAASMEGGDKVTISGFGSFRVVDKPAQKGRNPQTGEELIIPPRRVVKFKPSKKLTAKVS